MSSVYWCEKLSVGLPEMDHQHCQLLEMLGDLQEAVRHGWPVEKLAPTAQRLIEHTAVHFRDEEAFMQDIGFPEWEEHKRTHEKLVQEVEQRLARFLEEKGSTAGELLAYLLAWVADHIQEEDMKYAEYARRHMASEAVSR